MHTSFIGIKTAQSPRTFELWEEFLTGIDFKRIIEIGTYKWGMSLFFFLWCKTKQAEFFTYDIKFFPMTRVLRELGIKKHFKQVDVFEEEKEIAELIEKDGITILFCDGGDKVRELNTFSKYLKRGDFIVVHDWGTEVFEHQVPSFLELYDGDEITKIFQYA